MSGDLQTKYLLALADYDNLKKRMDKQIECAVFENKMNFVKGLLPVVDAFDKALETSILDEGIETIHYMLNVFLKNNGVEAIIPNEGDKFNESLHEAVDVVFDSGKEENIISNVQLKGYKIDGKVVRYAKVCVYGVIV